MTSTLLNIGHRGAAAYATENTLSSIQTALDHHVDMVELDVRRTKDDQLILCHDKYLHGQGQKLKIRRHTLKQLQHLPLKGGETVATLDQALRFINTRALVNIDLKETGYEQQVVEQVNALHLGSRVMYSSLNRRSLQKVKKLSPDQFVALSYPSSLLIRLYEIPLLKPIWDYIGRKNKAMYPFNLTIKTILPYRVRRLTLDQGIDALIIRSPFVSPKLVDAVRRKELKLYSWPADATEEVQRLKSLGVDGISSNKPDLLRSHTDISPTSTHATKLPTS